MNKLISKYRNLPVQLKASFWFLMCAVVQKGIGVITTPIFTRILTTTEYGQFSVFNSWEGIISVFLTLNLASGVFVQGLVKFDNEKKVFTSSLQGLCLTITTIWLGIYLLFHSFFNRTFSLNTVQMLLMFVIIWTSTVFQFWSVEQRVDNKYMALVPVTLASSIASPGLGLIFIHFMDNHVTARILGVAVSQVIMFSDFFFLQMYRGKRFFSSKFWKYAVKFNLPLIPHYLSGVILGSADRIMISSMSGDDKAGIYSLAYSVSTIMTIFNQALLQTVEPWLYKKIKNKEFDAMSRVSDLTFIFIALVNLCLMALAPEVISIFAPSQYYEAIYIVPPVAMSCLFSYMYSYFATFEFYYEKTHYVTIATMTGALVNIALNYICIRTFGYIAAGYTTLVCYIIYAVMHYIFMRTICRKNLQGINPYNIKHIIAIALLFMLLGFLCLALYNHLIIRYCTICIVFVGCLIKRKDINNLLKRLLELRQEAK